MSTPAASYLKVFYDLRPAKQVERRMIMDALQVMAEGGLPLRDHRYVGMGSISFVDFIMFHRLLGVRELLSVEVDDRIEQRVNFNRPFAQVSVRMGSIGEALPELDRDRRHLVWMDYDSRLSAEILRDVVLAAELLQRGSVVLVTIDVDAPGDDAAVWRKHYEEEADEYLPIEIRPEDFAKSELGFTSARILWNAFSRGLSFRKSLRYLPLFAFAYADGHQMLTVGGVIGGDDEEAKLNGSRVAELPFVKRDLSEKPFRIEVPRLTRKERLYLDQYMPCADGWAPAAFELSAAEVEEYRKIYRYYPMYGELLF